jgi:pimeloyl-ACP methyl ester carboxylesterase
MVTMRRILFLILSLICVVVACPTLAQAGDVSPGNTKELNFVFLHGLNGNASAMQILDDSIADRLPAYVTNYQYAHPGISISSDRLLRSYPNNVDIESWAHNIADAINLRFPGKKNLVLIGHSMGGKTALYAVAHNIGGLADKVAMVVTINSPVKSLVNYYYVGGDTALDYWGAQKLVTSRGVLESLVDYDSSQDGQWVGTHKRWLAFVSAESSPLSNQFDVNGIDALPRELDDQIVPISAQYAEGADVVYYGEYVHSGFTESKAASGYLADQILSYIFGGYIECSVFARGGAFEHKADILPGTDYWQDLVGGVLADSGTITHHNGSFFKWQTWDDVVGEYLSGKVRSGFETTQKNSSPLLTGITQSSWTNPDDLQDGRLSLTTRVAPLGSIQVDWSVYQQGLLPQGNIRDHYEIELETGSQFTSIGQVSWQTSDPRDLRLRISSQAESPFRWFAAKWRVYYKESRFRQIIDEIQ